ncbi:dentin sialophosphoprotein-like [Pecten maximus]|uniref:dentin sialophosphoprotein-like n=1 Tax=Pecten maximus TaxID=6579 RepID=UPI0014585083|nr:dentin sialophosphoprotein-like [Pecten maximus]
MKHNPSIVVHDLNDSDGSDGSDGSDQSDRSESSSSSSSSSSESDEDERDDVGNNRRGNERDRSDEDRGDDDSRDRNDNNENIKDAEIVGNKNNDRKVITEYQLQQIYNNKNEQDSEETSDENGETKETKIEEVTDGLGSSKSEGIDQGDVTGPKSDFSLPLEDHGSKNILEGEADDKADSDESRPRGEDNSNESRPRGEDDGRPRGENTAGGKKHWPKLVPDMFKSLVPEAKKNNTKHTVTAESKKNNTKGQQTVSKSNHGWPYFVPEVFKPLIPDTERNGTQAEDNSDTYKQNNNLSYTDTYVMDQYMENLPYAKSMLTFGEAGEHETEHTDASGGGKTQSADFNIPPDEIKMQNGGAGYSSANESSGVGNNNKSPFKVNYSGMSATGSHGVDDKNKSPGKMKPPGKEGGEAAGNSHQQVPDNKPGKVKGKNDNNSNNNNNKSKATETQSSGGGTVPKGQGSPKGDQYNRPPGNVPSVSDR